MSRKHREDSGAQLSEVYLDETGWFEDWRSSLFEGRSSHQRLNFCDWSVEATTVVAADLCRKTSENLDDELRTTVNWSQTLPVEPSYPKMRIST